MAKNDKTKETSSEVSNNDTTNDTTATVEVSTPTVVEVTTPAATQVEVKSPISHNITNWLKNLVNVADNDLKGTLHALDLAFDELKVIGARLESHASDDVKKLVQYIKSL